MAVSNLVVKQDYVGNGVTVTFAIPFTFIRNSQIHVYLLDTTTGVSTPQVISTNYTYDNPTNPTNIIMNVAPAVGKWLRVIRETVINQDTEIENNGEFLEEEMETALDKLTLMMQEVSSRMDSALVLNPVDAGVGQVLPKIVANAVLGSNPSATAYVWRAASDFVGPQGPQGIQGIQGAQGIQGIQGATGYGLYIASGAPSNGLGNDNDVYINKDNFNLYYKVTGAWVVQGNLKGAQGDPGVQGLQGIQGIQGVPGTNGTNGMNGADGSMIYTNSGVPSPSLGKDLDIYIDTQAPSYFYQKLTGTWVIRNQLQGLQGPAGADGAIGPTAFGLFIQPGVPNPAFGNNNDVWIDNLTYDLYYKVSGTWVLQGSLRPPGFPAAGTTGQILRKASGTDYDTEWHSLVKADVGLGNVDNTSDANKPVSTATQTALSAKSNQTDMTAAQSDITTLQGSVSSLATAVAAKQDSLGTGTNGQLLTWSGGMPVWANPPATSPLTTKGDLYGHNGTVGVRVPVGTNGQLLTADSTSPSGVAWKAAPVSLPSQTGNAGKYLSTDGTTASWTDLLNAVATVQALNNAATLTLPAGLIKMVRVIGNVYPCSVNLPPGTLMGEQAFIEGTSNDFPVNVAGLFELYNGQVGHMIWNGTTWRKVGGV